MRRKLIWVFIIIIVLFATVGFSWKFGISNDTNMAAEEIIIDNESPIEEDHTLVIYVNEGDESGTETYIKSETYIPKEYRYIPTEQSDINHEAEEESYKAVLLDNGDFISTDLQNRMLNLKDIKEAVTDDESITVAAAKFAIIDLDNNGENQIVLWLQINGVSDYGFEILRYQDGSVYGYTLPYREFMDLKADGTFLFSGGAADSGVGRLVCSKEGYTIDKLYYSESQYNSKNEQEVRYFANGVSCSEEDFNNAMSRQGEKISVEWYDLTKDNVNRAFGGV